MRKESHRTPWRAGALLLLTLLSAQLTVGAPGPSVAAPSRSELEAAQERLQELERDFELTVERFNVVREELVRIQAEIAAEELAVDGLTERMSRNERAAAAVAEELYKAGSTDTLQAILSAGSLAEMEAGLEYLRSSENAQARVFERLGVDRRLLEEHISRLRTQQARALETKETLARLRAEIEAKLVDQRAEIERLTTLIERAERRRELRRQHAAEAAAAAAPAPSQIAQAGDDSTSSPGPAPTSAPAPSSRAQAAVQAALEQIGKPYSYGAAGPDAFDCSGLTMWAWARAGVALPHSSAAQYAATARVAQGAWQPGDLLFYGSPIHHVAMYIGDGRIVEAPYTGMTVRIASAMRSDYVGAGRPGV